MILKLPDRLPIFPLNGALLLPRGSLPLNIFEPRYLDLVDYALKSEHRMIGMVQYLESLEDKHHTSRKNYKNPPMAKIGCAGRITVFNEMDEDRYQIILSGIHRFHILSETPSRYDFRICKIGWNEFAGDETADDFIETERKQLLRIFREYLYAHELEAEWEGVDEANNETLINALCMMAPFNEKEKQALLEAKNLNNRGQMLLAITERYLVARAHEDKSLQ